MQAEPRDGDPMSTCSWSQRVGAWRLVIQCSHRGSHRPEGAERLWWGLAGSVPSPVGGLMQTRRGATMTYLGADFAAVRVPRDRRR